MKKVLTFLGPILISLLSLSAVSLFFRYYLLINSEQLVREFKNQNYREIYSANTLQISSRLNSLSNAVNWVCLEASIQEKTFYKIERGRCHTGLIQQRQVLTIPQANNIKISFTTRLPQEVEKLFAFFFILQFFLIVALFLSTKKQQEEKRESEIKINKIARQVSHDIRSPVATLSTIISKINYFQEEDRILLLKATQRINEISNHLLSTSLLSKDSFIPINETCEISEVIEEIVVEKKIEHSNIQITMEATHFKLYSFLDKQELKRIFSNLLNNSIEAKHPEKELNIQIIIEKHDSMIKVFIKDNGRGISQDILSKIGKSEITTKKTGNGLGIRHAIESINSWNGTFQIKSVINKGTEILISLPISSIESNITVLLDDDELVRLTWQSVAKKRGIDFIAFENYLQLKEAVSTISKDSQLYIDSMLGNGKSGESIAEELYKEGFSNIFITSGHEQDRFKHLTFLKGVTKKSPPW